MAKYFQEVRLLCLFDPDDCDIEPLSEWNWDNVVSCEDPDVRVISATAGRRVSVGPLIEKTMAEAWGAGGKTCKSPKK
jgi:hypothetical protein